MKKNNIIYLIVLLIFVGCGSHNSSLTQPEDRSVSWEVQDKINIKEFKKVKDSLKKIGINELKYNGNSRKLIEANIEGFKKERKEYQKKYEMDYPLAVWREKDQRVRRFFSKLKKINHLPEELKEFNGLQTLSEKDVDEFIKFLNKKSENFFSYCMDEKEPMYQSIEVIYAKGIANKHNLSCVDFMNKYGDWKEDEQQDLKIEMDAYMGAKNLSNIFSGIEKNIKVLSLSLGNLDNLEKTLKDISGLLKRSQMNDQELFLKNRFLFNSSFMDEKNICHFPKVKELNLVNDDENIFLSKMVKKCVDENGLKLNILSTSEFKKKSSDHFKKESRYKKGFVHCREDGELASKNIKFKGMENLKCIKGGEMIIEGDISMSHENENVWAEIPNKVYILSNRLKFEKGTQLKSDSTLNILIKNETTGYVKISSSRGMATEGINLNSNETINGAHAGNILFVTNRIKFPSSVYLNAKGGSGTKYGVSGHGGNITFYVLENPFADRTFFWDYNKDSGSWGQFGKSGQFQNGILSKEDFKILEQRIMETISKIKN